MSGFDLTKYRQMFQEESVELFETIDSILLDAEANETLDDEAMNSLFRAMHTLKGGSASVELREFAVFTHEVESFLDKLRNHQIAYHPAMADVLIDSADMMKELLDQELNDSVDSNLIQESKVLLSRLKECENKKEEMSQAQVSEVKTSPSIHSPSPAQTQTESFGRPGRVSDETSFGFSENVTSSTKSAAQAVNNQEAFGFFDGTPAGHATESFGFFEEATPIKDESEAFGFFDDVATSTPSSQHETNNAFGFFDTPEETQKRPDNEAFGFFNDDIDALAKTLPDTLPAASLISAPVKQEVPVATPGKSNEKSESKAEAKPSALSSATNSIRVDLSKIDHLMNNIGELVIANSMLSQYAQTIADPKIQIDIFERLNIFTRHIRELQESVMSVRMVPMETIYSKFPKVIRDTAKKLGKKVEFRHLGDSVEIDKVMIEGLTDPLTHIVRNSLDHGLETPEERLSHGKSDFGTITMGAEQSNGQIIITIQDDGRGINLDRVTKKAFERGIIDAHQLQNMSKEEKAMLIFAPGLSTAEKITDISGRGVGMDVVLSNIKKLGGTVMIDTEEGIGTTLTIALPLTLAILDGLNVGVGYEQYILPLAVIIESLQPTHEMIKQVGDRSSELLMLRNEFIPIVRLHKIFNVAGAREDLTKGMLIIVRIGNQKISLFVDEFLDQQQFVVKPLDKNFRTAQGIGGATVRGDGSIGLIIDVMSLLDKQEHHEKGNL